MNKEVEELAEWVARKIYEYDFTGFNPKWGGCPNPSHWLNLAKQILSHPDLALIDRGQKVLGKDIRDKIIPLADTLKD